MGLIFIDFELPPQKPRFGEMGKVVIIVTKKFTLISY